MKKYLLLLGLFSVIISGSLFSQTAKVQIIHNSADPAAAVVDIYVNDELAIPDFEFRTATAFLDLPSGVNLKVDIAPGISMSSDDALATYNYVLDADEQYIIVANGLLSSDGFSNFEAFNLYVQPMAQLISKEEGNTDVLVFHGATDAPTVDILESAVLDVTAVDDLMYGEFQGYLELPTYNYVLEVQTMDGITNVKSYDVPLADLGLENQALIAIASGFLAPDSNNDGADFGVYVALPTGGELIPLVESKANVQVIHNSADPDAYMVDIYMNGEILVPDFMFRTATPFVELPAGVDIEIAIAPGTSMSVEDALATYTYKLESGETYAIVANGLLSSEGFSNFEAFDLYVKPMAQMMSMQEDYTDVLVFHGATDAPTVDIFESAVLGVTAVDDLMYGEFQGYLELPTDNYVLEVQTMDGMTTVKSYDVTLADLGLENQALIAVASGFLAPDANNDGADFGVFVVLPTGGELVQLGESKANVQVIHNSADPDAYMVDIYMNGEILVPDFMFRTATPFVELPAGVDIEIAIAPGTSMSVEDALATYTYKLESGETYAIVANGLLSSEGFSNFEAFDLYVKPMAQMMAMEEGNTDVLVFHGATDAPTVDIFESAVLGVTAVDDLMYGEFQGYLELPTDNYVLEVQTMDGMTNVKSYDVPLADLSLDNLALIAVASGFLAPDANNDGADFGVFVALPTGGELVQLSESKANVQVIHNSADPDAYMVDIYMNGEILVPDFMFRTATPFVELPAGVDIEIAIAPGTSMSVEDALATYTYKLESGESYIIVANGLLSAEGFSNFEAFDLYVKPMAQMMSMQEDYTDVLVFHGATDAPTVDVFESSVLEVTAVDDLMYGDFQGYLELPTENYTLEIQDETGTSTVVTYDAPLASLGLYDYALTILASGFLTPEDDNNGAAFGLYVALPAGGSLIPLEVSNPLGIEQFSDIDFSVYPNPATDIIYINGLDMNTDISIEIFNNIGQLVHNIDASNPNPQIDVSDLNSGQYIIAVKYDNQIVQKRLSIVK